MTTEIQPLRNEAEAEWIFLVRSKISTYSVRSLRVSLILTALFLQESLLSLESWYDKVCCNDVSHDDSVVPDNCLG